MDDTHDRGAVMTGANAGTDRTDEAASNEGYALSVGAHAGQWEEWHG